MSVASILADVPLPEVVTVRQSLPRPRLAPGQMEQALSPAAAARVVRPGESIAVAVGSRGVADQAAVVARLVTALRAAGAEPFIVPAMGSHGGATAEGQAALLAGMGVSERAAGAPVRSGMEVERIGAAGGVPVLVDRLAWRADGIIVVNRIKPHPSFRGDRESGLAKMIAIGLGKQAGAQACHARGMPAMAATVLAVAGHVLATGRVRAGVAVLENAHHETCHVELIPGAEILAREPALLARARGLQPTLPFRELDVLVLDRIGKNIAGTGFDCNVVGRYSNPELRGGPAITRIAALRLSPETHGNANGIGLVDVTTRRVFERMTFEETYPNALTSTASVSVKIPMVMANDALAIRAAVRTAGVADPAALRLARIGDTLSLSELQASPAAAAALDRAAQAGVDGPPASIVFDEAGDLPELNGA